MSVTVGRRRRPGDRLQLRTRRTRHLEGLVGGLAWLRAATWIECLRKDCRQEWWVKESWLGGVVCVDGWSGWLEGAVVNEALAWAGNALAVACLEHPSAYKLALACCGSELQAYVSRSLA